MSDVADRLRALAVSSWCGTNNCPPGESCDVCEVRRGYADALDKTGEWIPAEEELLSRARAAGDTLGAACHSYARDVLVGLQTELLASAARLFPEDAA